MLKSKYKAFEIQDDKVSETVVEGNLIAIADFIKNCKEGSIITIHTLDGEPFLIGLSKLFLLRQRKTHRLQLPAAKYIPTAAAACFSFSEQAVH